MGRDNPKPDRQSARIENDPALTRAMQALLGDITELSRQISGSPDSGHRLIETCFTESYNSSGGDEQPELAGAYAQIGFRPKGRITAASLGRFGRSGKKKIEVKKKKAKK